jgi:hypothetical protein
MPAPGSNAPPRAALGNSASGKPAPTPRDAIALAFDEIGGVSALAEWVEASEDNRKIFYSTIYPKILSLEFGGEPDGAAIDEVRYTIVRP